MISVKGVKISFIILSDFSLIKLKTNRKMKTIKNSCGGQGCYLEDYKKKLGYDDISKNANASGKTETKLVNHKNYEPTKR